MSSALLGECLAMGGYPRMTMSETELSVICKNCGSEVSPYVTECPYCGARLRKRAPKLERRGDGLEAKPRRRRRPAFLRRPSLATDAPFRPYATMAAILGPAILLLIQKAGGSAHRRLRRHRRAARRPVVALPHCPLCLHRRRLPLCRRGRPGDLRHGAGAAPRHGADGAAADRLRLAGDAGRERDRQRTGQHRGDRRRQRGRPRCGRRLVRDPPRRGARRRSTRTST